MQRLEVSGAARPIYGSLGVKRLRMCGSLPPLLLYAFTAWTWTILPYLYKLLAKGIREQPN